MVLNNLSNNTVLPPGFILGGRYKTIEVIGEGGFSITYRAIHNDMHKIVAIKEFFYKDYMCRDIRVSNDVHLLHESDAERLEKDLDSFLNEAKTLADLSNLQGVVHVTDYFRENRTAYIVMEIVEGISLEDQLKKRLTFTWDELIRKFLPIISALSAVHKKGLVHRDIKPGNILIGGDGSFTLIDFGAALHFKEEGEHSVYLTEGYAPKEQYLRKGVLGEYTDVYALCAVLYQCLTGIIPDHSLQRTVFDELKKPSDLGVQVPDELERIIMKGLEVEPENRWQNMDEMREALQTVLPKPKRVRRGLYLLAGIVAAFVLIGAIYLAQHRTEIQINKMEEEGKVISFRLDAPEEMTANEFEEAVFAVRQRADALAGQNHYLMKTGGSSILLKIPEEYFNLEEGVNVENLLYVVFSFSGKWLLHNSDLTELIKVKPENIINTEIVYGSIPVVTRSGDPLIYDGETIDWSEEEGYYLKMEFDDKTSDFLKEYLTQEGYKIMAVAHLEYGDLVNSLSWISQGDGKTAYLSIGPDKNMAEIMYQVMTAKPYSSALELTFETEEEIDWFAPDKEHEGMCSVEDFSTSTVEAVYELSYFTEMADCLDYLKNQLETLGIPYAIGCNENLIHIRMPSGKINSLVLATLRGDYTSIQTNWNKTIVSRSNIEKAEVIQKGSDNLLNIYYSEWAMEEVAAALNDTSTNQLFLYLGDVRIGEQSGFDPEKQLLQFTLYLPKDDSDAISNEQMTAYLCNTISFGDIVAYYYKEIWRDEHNELLSRKAVPVIPTGLDDGRFSSIITHVKDLGGQASYVIDTGYTSESIIIKYNQWTGNFPEEALNMIESEFSEFGFANNICSHIAFTIHSWYKGDPVSIDVHFYAEECSKQMVCTSGLVKCNDQAVLQRAEDYVSKSTILTASEDRFSEDNEGAYFPNCYWEYKNNYD